MDVITAIRTRRSIRRYTGAPVAEEALQAVLEAGFCAPSAHNRRPWHFLVVREPGTLQAIADAHPYAKMMPAAGCCIIVCGDRDLQPALGLLIEDCSAAIQNMLLAAHGLDLGAVWCGLYIGDDGLHVALADLMGIPAQMLPVGMIALGHPAEQKDAISRFSPERVHHEDW